MAYHSIYVNANPDIDIGRLGDNLDSRMHRSAQAKATLGLYQNHCVDIVLPVSILQASDTISCIYGS